MIIVVSSGHKPDDERIYHREIKSLIRAGYSIQYFTRWDGKMDLSMGNLNHINLQRSQFTLRNYINYIIKNIGIVEILHIHEFDLLPLAKKLKQKYNTKIIYDVHDSLREMWETFSTKRGLIKKIINCVLSEFEKYHLKFVDEIILANQPFKKGIYSNWGIPETIVENFPIIEKLADSKSLNDQPIILYQGQVSQDRGLMSLLDAFQLVRDLKPKATLQIIGPSRPANYSNILKQKVKAMGYNNHVSILDDIPHEDIWDYMKDASIGVIPSLQLPRVLVDTPTKLFEYMASGCVVVATDLPPIRRFLEGTGQLVVHESPEELAHGIIELLTCKNLYTNYSQESISRIQNKYNWSFPENRLLKLYQKLTT